VSTETNPVFPGSKPNKLPAMQELITEKNNQFPIQDFLGHSPKILRCEETHLARLLFGLWEGKHGGKASNQERHETRSSLARSPSFIALSKSTKLFNKRSSDNFKNFF
jgi:hypothetical protein